MTEKQLEEFIEKISVRGSIMGLDTIRVLLDKMGNPQDRLKTVHIAGTNGKGSTLCYISTVLSRAGYKTGAYISPVICDYREKIQINGRFISKSALLEGMGLIKNKCEEMVSEGYACPTAFEAETALAFWYFEKKACDIAVIETGMGGEDDATNVIKAPLVSVLTSISLDHMAFLGDSVEKIAVVKAGIIKNGCPVVSAPLSLETQKVIENKCAECGAELHIAGTAVSVRQSRLSQTFSYNNYKNIKSGLLGTYQLINAAVALEAVEVLKKQGFSIADKALYQGMEEAAWYGRFSVLSSKPLIIADGAHNEAAAIKLMESVELYLKDQPLIYVMGILRDKEYEKVINITAGRAAQIVTVATPGNPRALSSLELAEAVSGVNKNVTAASSVEEGLELAELLAGDKCGILIFGSLSFLGRVKKFYESRRRKTHGK